MLCIDLTLFPCSDFTAHVSCASCSHSFTANWINFCSVTLNVFFTQKWKFYQQCPHPLIIINPQDFLIYLLQGIW